MTRAKLLVRDWMTPDPATVGPLDPLHTAVGLLRRRGIRAVPVVERKTHWHHNRSRYAPGCAVLSIAARSR